MSNTQIIIAVIAVAVVSFAGLGIMRAATAHSGFNYYKSGHGHAKGAFYQTHLFSHEDWQDSEKLQHYKSQCKEKGAHKFDHFLQHVHDKLELSPEQQGKWQDLSAAINTETDTVNQICEKIFTQENLADTPARLELMTTVLAMGTESLQRIQPYVNTLYQSLDAGQKNEFDDMMSHRRHRGWF